MSCDLPLNYQSHCHVHYPILGHVWTLLLSTYRIHLTNSARSGAFTLNKFQSILNEFHTSPMTFTNFHRCTIESTLLGCRFNAHWRQWTADPWSPWMVSCPSAHLFWCSWDFMEPFDSLAKSNKCIGSQSGWSFVFPAYIVWDWLMELVTLHF